LRFEQVRERLQALPREMPAAPAILTPIRLDSPESLFPHRPLAPVRQAGVLVLLFPDDLGEGRVLLTVRVPHLSAHAGEISFPGGSAEPGDADPVVTALREAAEEIGLDPEACGLQVVGALERFLIPVSGFRVTPVVALAERRPDCRPDPNEVARIIEPAVEAFLPDAPVELEERVIRERLIRYGVYPVEGERVWGATARMLGQLGALLATEPAPEAAWPATQSAAASAPEPARTPADEPRVRRATTADQPAIEVFLAALAPELARSLPPASELLLAEVSGRVVGLASWAPWDRPRAEDEPRGFDGLAFDEDAHPPAELTLLAVAPHLRGRGIGRSLTDAIAAAAGSAGCRRLLAWTLAETAIHPSSVAARAFFRANGFNDVAVDRRYPARGEDRLLMSRPLS
jgi:8-oxo-dGTP pyrophosphatase MutT (NUDIX family)/ribosomal protein S18 acetylase RimI-like enzyme